MRSTCLIFVAVCFAAVCFAAILSSASGSGSAFDTDGAIPANRLVTLGSDSFLNLAGATDENVIGHSVHGMVAATDYLVVQFKGSNALQRVEVAAGVTFTPGEVAYQAADGKVADTGTIRVGVCLVGATAGQVARLTN